MGPNSFGSCLLVAIRPQYIFLNFSKIKIVKNIFEIWNPMKTNIFWPHCLWLYSCRGSESTLESTYTSSISKVVNGRMAHQGTTIDIMCSCFRDASFSFCHLSLSKVKRTSQVISFSLNTVTIDIKHPQKQLRFIFYCDLSGGVLLTLINSEYSFAKKSLKDKYVFWFDSHWLSHTLVLLIKQDRRATKKIVKTLMEFFHKIKFLTENTINYDVTFGTAGGL